MFYHLYYKVHPGTKTREISQTCMKLYLYVYVYVNVNVNEKNEFFYPSFHFSSEDQIVTLVQASFGSANNALELTFLILCDICILVTLFTSVISKQ